MTSPAVERRAYQKYAVDVQTSPIDGHSVFAADQYSSAISSRRESAMPTRLVAASASPMIRAVSTGEGCRSSPSSQALTLDGFVSGALAG